MRTILTAFHAEALTNTANTPLLLSATAQDRRPDSRKNVVVKSTVAGYLGGALVTAAGGYPIAAGEAYTFDSAGGLYFFAATSGTINILEGF